MEEKKNSKIVAMSAASAAYPESFHPLVDVLLAARSSHDDPPAALAITPGNKTVQLDPPDSAPPPPEQQQQQQQQPPEPAQKRRRLSPEERAARDATLAAKREAKQREREERQRQAAEDKARKQQAAEAKQREREERQRQAAEDKARKQQAAEARQREREERQRQAAEEKARKQQAAEEKRKEREERKREEEKKKAELKRKREDEKKQAEEERRAKVQKREEELRQKEESKKQAEANRKRMRQYWQTVAAAAPAAATATAAATVTAAVPVAAAAGGGGAAAAADDAGASAAGGNSAEATDSVHWLFRPIDLDAHTTVPRPIERRTTVVEMDGALSAGPTLAELAQQLRSYASVRRKGKDEAPTPVRRGPRFKLLQFHDNNRPAYYGTHHKHCRAIGGRRPFAHEDGIDYEVESDLEWEEEDVGESLSDSDNDDDDEDDANGAADDPFVVPDGYLSSGEGDRSVDEGGDMAAAPSRRPAQQPTTGPAVAGVHLDFERLRREAQATADAALQAAVRALLPLRAMQLVPERPGEFYDDDGAASATVEGEDDESARPPGRPPQLFPDELVSELARLVHGSFQSRERLADGFHTAHPDLSKVKIERKIMELAAKQRRKAEPIRRWRVVDEAAYGLTSWDALPDHVSPEFPDELVRDLALHLHGSSEGRAVLARQFQSQHPDVPLTLIDRKMTAIAEKGRGVDSRWRVSSDVCAALGLTRELPEDSAITAFRWTLARMVHGSRLGMDKILLECKSKHPQVPRVAALRILQEIAAKSKPEGDAVARWRVAAPVCAAAGLDPQLPALPAPPPRKRPRPATPTAAAAAAAVAAAIVAANGGGDATPDAAKATASHLLHQFVTSFNASAPLAKVNAKPKPKAKAKPKPRAKKAKAKAKPEQPEAQLQQENRDTNAADVPDAMVVPNPQPAPVEMQQ